MGNDTTVGFNESDCESCLANLATYLEEIMEQKKLTEGYELGEGYEGKFYDKLCLYLETLSDAENDLHTVLNNYREFMSRVISAYQNVDEQR